MTRPTIEDARTALRTHFGYDDFRPGQARAVASVLDARDTLVILPTGGGKSICYQVPALLLPGLTVVVSPLISLMKDQVDALTARGLPAAFVNSTLSSGEVSDRLARAQRGEIKLLYVAPERFDFANTAERIAKMGVSLLALDEAHCISEWGHDFRPSYLRMAQVRERLGNPPVVALTATATPEVRRDIARQLSLRDPETVITGFDRINLRYHVVPTRTDDDKDRALVQAIRDAEGLAVVYASTRRAVERVARVLERARIPSVAYHAGLDDKHRHEVQDAFMREDVRAIVATNAFGMGIDKPNVRLVVHHAMPGTLEAYYQEAGRAGRDGLPSDCVLLHSFPDRFTHEFFIKGAYPERAVIDRVYNAISRDADRAGRLDDLDAERLALRAGGKTSAREVESVLRVLVQAGAVLRESESASRVYVRLLATPDRIKRELGAENGLELALLRSLWKSGGGDRVYEGVALDLEMLPPGLGGAPGALPLLEGLQRRQFLTFERDGGGARLAQPGAPLAAIRIDWETLDRRRRGDLAKLDAMQQYAYPRGCRRGFVLRYFGDPAARQSCGACDNCLGTHVPASEEPRAKPRKRSDAPRERQTPRGRVVGTDDVLVRFEETNEAPALDQESSEMLARLKALRTTIAREDRVPPYVVFPDRTLAELAVRRPRTTHAMAEVRGVGPMKLEKYGERFLAVLRDETTEAA
ncbi:MAG: RecQ family ATP-dependent DNA helicase [Gemmatimonadaceae bacterium]|nr:RecQ family ATP-dependent DNA helicase [Gemmatimonadaceae bacterium]